MRELRVNLKENGYSITIGSGILHTIGEKLASKKVLVVTDENVAPLYLEMVLAALKDKTVSSLILPPGEHTKSLQYLSRVYDALCENRFTRTDTIVALGGGVIGDLAGFAAATYMRGIPYIQVPTSLLAQVDSAVGGKVAIDLPQGKNLAGAFYQPQWVLIDTHTLSTLPQNIFLDGLGEVVKYGCLNDPELFTLLENNPTREMLMAHMENMITACLTHKKTYVEQDEKDTGTRMALNFGHTIGHAIETAQHYEGLRHGEAVAVGMNLVTKLSEAKGLTQEGTAARLESLLKALGLPVSAHISGHLADYLTLDKKNLNNVLTCILLDRIGSHILYKTDGAFFAEADLWLR